MRPWASTARLTRTWLVPFTVTTKAMAVAVLEVTETSERLFMSTKGAFSDAAAGAGRAARKARSKCAATCEVGMGWWRTALKNQLACRPAGVLGKPMTALEQRRQQRRLKAAADGDRNGAADDEQGREGPRSATPTARLAGHAPPEPPRGREPCPGYRCLPYGPTDGPPTCPHKVLQGRGHDDNELGTRPAMTPGRSQCLRGEDEEARHLPVGVERETGLI